MEDTIEYLVSRSILKELLKDNMITEDEFNKIDMEDKKSFSK